MIVSVSGMHILLFTITNGLFGWRVKWGGAEGSRVEFTKNKLILYQIYSTLLYSPSLSINPNRP